MAFHGPGEQAVAGRGQDESPALLLLVPQPGKQLLVIGKRRGIDGAGLGQPCFQYALAFHQPTCQTICLQRVPGDELVGRLVEQISLDKRAVEVDDQWQCVASRQWTTSIQSSLSPLHMSDSKPSRTLLPRV